MQKCSRARGSIEANESDKHSFVCGKFEWGREKNEWNGKNEAGVRTAVVRAELFRFLLVAKFALELCWKVSPQNSIFHVLPSCVTCRADSSTALTSSHKTFIAITSIVRHSLQIYLKLTNDPHIHHLLWRSIVVYVSNSHPLNENDFFHKKKRSSHFSPTVEPTWTA